MLANVVPSTATSVNGPMRIQQRYLLVNVVEIEHVAALGNGTIREERLRTREGREVRPNIQRHCARAQFRSAGVAGYGAYRD
jgi:hypothetical protein